jgi:two-component system response regulator CpxR
MKRILIVDDELSITEVLAMVMKAEGFDVETATNGEEGLQQLERSHFDVVLLDLMMPVMDGLEMLSRMRKRNPTADTPVVLMSAGSPDVMQIKEDYSAYLPKPFNLPDLIRTIKSAAAN